MNTIIAQSGAGKSTFCKKHKWCIDGDVSYEMRHMYKALDDKFGIEWKATLWNKAWPYYNELAEGVKRKLSGRRGWITLSTINFADSHSIFVIPKPGVVRRQLLKPRDGHSFEHDQVRAKNAEDDRKKVLAAARKLGCLVFESFDDLGKASVL